MSIRKIVVPALACIAALLSTSLSPSGIQAASAGRMLITLGSATDDDGEESTEVERMVVQAFENATRRYSSRYPVDFVPTVYAKGKLPPGAIAVHVYLDLEDEQLSIIAKDSSGEAVDSSWLDVKDRRLADISLPYIFFSFWLNSRPYPSAGRLLTVGTLDLRAISPLLSEQVNYYPVPVGIAAAGSRQAWLAVSDRIVRLGPLMSIEESLTLSEPGAWVQAFRLAVTNAGTLYMTTLAGDLYKYRQGGKPERVALGLGSIFSFAPLGDGSLAFWEASSQKMYKIEGRKKSRLDLGAIAAGSGILTSDEDGRLWVYDYTSQSVVVALEDGTPVDAFRVKLPSGQAPMSLLATADRGFIVQTQNGLFAFDRDGVPRWGSVDIRSALDGDPVIIGTCSLDRHSGAIWLTDMAKQAVTLLYDTELSGDLDLSVERELAALNEAVMMDPEDAAMQETRADRVEELGSFPLAHGYRVRATTYADVSDRTYAKIQRFDLSVLLARARWYSGQAMRDLERFGTETARSAYTQSLQFYERYLALAASDPLERENAKAARSEKDSLERAFSGGGSNAAPDAPGPTVASAAIGPFFPALLNTYASAPSCKVVVENSTGTKVDSYAIRVEIKGFLDFPVEVTVKGPFAAGAETEVALSVPINKSALELQEDIEVQALVEVTARAGSAATRGSKVVSATIRNRSAISWKDSAALASFVTPNDEPVAAFAREALVMAGYSGGGREPLLSPAFSRAQILVDALGALGFSYVEDPRTPITKVLGSETVDTVRFARFTLFTRAGDCDDTTALLASLFESAGLSTAILTTPGHVLLAFDSGEPAAAAWLYGTPTAGTIAKDGTLWIPVETTVLGEGFRGAWEKGWRVWSQAASSGKTEFLPVSAQRARYPAIPLGNSGGKAPLPLAESFREFDARTRAKLEATVYSGAKSSIEAELAATKEPLARAKLLNRAGILEAQFGRYLAAEARFLSAIDSFPDYGSSYMNLYRTRELAGDREGAELALRMAVTRFPDSASFNAAYGEFLASIGRTAEAEKYLTKARKAGAEVGAAAAGGSSRGASADGGGLWEY
jgi:hypothetical protein